VKLIVGVRKCKTLMLTDAEDKVVLYPVSYYCTVFSQGPIELSIGTVSRGRGILMISVIEGCQEGTRKCDVHKEHLAQLLPINTKWGRKLNVIRFKEMGLDSVNDVMWSRALGWQASVIRQ